MTIATRHELKVEDLGHGWWRVTVMRGRAALSFATVWGREKAERTGKGLRDAHDTCETIREGGRDE